MQRPKKGLIAIVDRDDLDGALYSVPTKDMMRGDLGADAYARHLKMKGKKITKIDSVITT